MHPLVEIGLRFGNQEHVVHNFVFCLSLGRKSSRPHNDNVWRPRISTFGQSFSRAYSARPRHWKATVLALKVSDHFKPRAT
jgi:hypothetical protein